MIAVMSVSAAEDRKSCRTARVFEGIAQQAGSNDRAAAEPAEIAAAGAVSEQRAPRGGALSCNRGVVPCVLEETS